MTGVLKYRIVALLLAVVFGVFNVGIPIIVASCPMAAMMQQGKCDACGNQDDPPGARITREINTSCCVTTVVAERNTHEFVQDQAQAHHPVFQAVLVLLPYAVTRNPSPVSASIPVSASPPGVVDIPILTSSLLI